MGGGGVYVSVCTGESPGTKLKKKISLSLPPLLPVLNHDKNPSSSEKPIDRLLGLKKKIAMKKTFINDNLYLLSLSSSLCYWPNPWRGEYLSPGTPYSNLSSRGTWRTVSKCVLKVSLYFSLLFRKFWVNKCFVAGRVNLVILLHVFSGWKSQREPRVLVHVWYSLVNESTPKVPSGRLIGVSFLGKCIEILVWNQSYSSKILMTNPLED